MKAGKKDNVKTQNETPKDEHIHSDKGKVLLKVDNKTWIYVSKEKAKDKDFVSKWKEKVNDTKPVHPRSAPKKINKKEQLSEI